MKRWLTVAFIVVYLATLNFGVVCHTMGFATGSHPLMYFIVWDMFCGWIAYESRIHVVGEGESQKYYDLSTPPWGEFHPWGSIGRQHYDMLNNHTGRIGMNTLRHTQHEPITRLFVVEEAWAKKYNLPDRVWQARYDGPKEIQKYYRVRSVLLPDGTITQTTGPWAQHQAIKMLGDNPRLQMQASRSRTVFVMDREQPGREMLLAPDPSGRYAESFNPPVVAPLGN